MPNPKLVCLNFLGSQKEIENSVTGFNGSDGRATKVYSAGKFGNGIDIALTVPSPGDNVTIDSIVVTSEGCVEAWIKFNGWSWAGTTASDSSQHFMYTTNTDVPQEWVFVYFHHGEGMHFDVFDGTAFLRLTSTTLTIPSNTFFHFAISWSETQQSQKTFFNGSELGSRTSVFNISDTKISDLSIGKRDINTIRGIRGVIDNVKVWSFFQTDFSKREQQRFGMNDSIVLI